MFGFITSPCPRCTTSSFPAWRGSFCGVARCLGREFGNPSRLLVNRDATFLALIGLSLDPTPPVWRRATCCNPLAAPFPVADDHPAIEHAAAVSVCGLAAKLTDDSQDEGPLRRTASRMVSALTGGATDRAIAHLNSSSFPTQSVLESLGAQDTYETHQPHLADQPTATAFGEITAHLARVLPFESERPRLLTLGASLGSLVYWRDAWDDQESDQRHQRFNPFHHLERSVIRDRIQTAWTRFDQSLRALPLVRNRELFLSLQQTTEQRHESFLALQPAEAKRKRRRKSRDQKQSNCWDPCCYCDCDCCPSCTKKGGAADACFDCGPGDSGCCDCNPCDGCDCCPCN